METSLNKEILDELVDIMGDDMGMLLNSYFSDSQVKLDELATLDCKTDQQTIFRVAHSLKGSSKNVGVETFAELCEEIEQLARNEKLTEEKFDKKQLNVLFQQCVKELKLNYL